MGWHYLIWQSRAGHINRILAVALSVKNCLEHSFAHTLNWTEEYKIRRVSHKGVVSTWSFLSRWCGSHTILALEFCCGSSSIGRIGYHWTSRFFIISHLIGARSSHTRNRNFLHSISLKRDIEKTIPDVSTAAAATATDAMTRACWPRNSIPAS